MADDSITAPVGAPPSLNARPDVKTVQKLLANVTPALSIRVEETGIVDRKTLHAIREFQSRFMSVPDSRVDPGGRTLWHLNEGFVAKYIHCDSRKRKILDRDLINAQLWLKRVSVRLNSMDDNAKTKVENVFHIGTADSLRPMRLTLLRVAYIKLSASLNESFPLQCELKPSVMGAWVDLKDTTGTMHFPPNHFDAPDSDRFERLIHERSHTVFQIGHAGMMGAGQLNFGAAPDDDNGFSYEQAVRNAYCYGWLAAALQPDYMPTSQGEVITAKPRK